ncbi:MAG TPA: NADH-quinone oxidoreductase subunit J [Egibacteraceae bacterium]|nr:NADH-quinone oxidoreductase subunit J [Egibacteraceae bacterium]
MSDSAWVDGFFWLFSVGAVASGWRVFKTASMVRASFLLLASVAAGAAVMLLLAAEYLGMALLFMMAVEMTVMALFMVAFMMNPAGLNPMRMVHQKTLAAVAGWVAFLGLAAVGVFGDLPDRPLVDAATALEDLGVELLGPSMLVFESAAVTLLAPMIGAVVLSSSRGRFGPADHGSAPPDADGEADERQTDDRRPR